MRVKNMNQLSKKERKYRFKIIAENHLKKDEQRYIDYYITKNKSNFINLTYKYLYLNYGLLHRILVQYKLSKLSNTMKSMGNAIQKATESTKILSASFASLGEYAKCKQLKR